MSAPTARRRQPLAGVGNLTAREAAGWWTTGRWRLQVLAWSAILAGLLAMMLWVMPAVVPDSEQGATISGDVADVAIQFPDLAAVVIAIGVVLLTQGLLLDERRNGVLEWLLSKPLTRAAVVVAKFAGHGLGLVASVVLVPWVAVHLLLSVAAGELWSPARGLAVMGLLALVVLFHLALVLALATVTDSRVAVLAIPLVALVSADGVTGVAPTLFEVLPYSLGDLASVVLAEGVLVSAWPVVATVGWTAALLAVAMWRLTRAEL